MKKTIIGTDHCISRAQRLLKKKNDSGLIYAALELRLGIECRLKQYLELHDRIPKKHKKTYRLNRLNRTVLRYLKVNDKIVRMTIQEKKTNKSLVFYYTPVRPKLVDIGVKLGDYLHYPVSNLGKLRSLVEQGLEELSLSNKGELMGPPLAKTKDGKPISIHMISLLKSKKKKIPKIFLEKGTQVIVNIEYLDDKFI